MGSATHTSDPVDTNALIVGLLRDLAAVQVSSQSRLGYKRAAAAIRNLDQPIESYLNPDGSLQKIQHVGPSSTRVILEVLQTGRSETVSRAIESSPKAREVENSRGLRRHFLTRSRVLAALATKRINGPTLRTYRGDLQMHSTWSDGSQTLQEIVEACLSRGYDYAAVTDHSYGLPIARGVSMERLAQQHMEIDRLNAEYAGRFRLLKGIEANIRADGRVDMEPEELRQLEIVVAAPHSILRSSADQTERLVRTVRTRGVNILGHPRGRTYGSREGVRARWQEVFAAAASSGVAVEIDGDPARQDIDFELAEVARDAGCLFALDSDAHGTSDFVFAETAIAHARLASIEPDRVVNCWPLHRLLAWAETRWER